MDEEQVKNEFLKPESESTEAQETLETTENKKADLEETIDANAEDLSQTKEEEEPKEEEVVKETSENESSLFLAQVNSFLVYPQKDQTPMLEAALQDFQKNGFLPTNTERARLHQYIEKKHVDAVIVGDYTTAEKFRLLSSEYGNACSEIQMDDQKSIIEDNIDSMIATTKDQLHQLRNHWNTIISSREENESRKMDQLFDTHRQQLNGFDIKYSNVDNLREYAKPSKRLLDIRKREKALLLLKDFNAARDLQRQGDIIESDETEIAQERAEQDINNKRNILLRKQALEVTLAKEHSAKLMQSTIQHKEAEESVLIARLDKLELDKAKVRSAKTVKAKLNSTTFVPLATAPVQSPRTRNRMLKFRKSTPTRRLVLKPVIRNSKPGSASRA